MASVSTEEVLALFILLLLFTSLTLTFVRLIPASLVYHRLRLVNRTIDEIGGLVRELAQGSTSVRVEIQGVSDWEAGLLVNRLTRWGISCDYVRGSRSLVCEGGG